MIRRRHAFDVVLLLGLLLALWSLFQGSMFAVAVTTLLDATFVFVRRFYMDELDRPLFGGPRVTDFEDLRTLHGIDLPPAWRAALDEDEARRAGTPAAEAPYQAP